MKLLWLKILSVLVIGAIGVAPLPLSQETFEAHQTLRPAAVGEQVVRAEPESAATDDAAQDTSDTIVRTTRNPLDLIITTYLVAGIVLLNPFLIISGIILFGVRMGKRLPLGIRRPMARVLNGILPVFLSVFNRLIGDELWITIGRHAVSFEKGGYLGLNRFSRGTLFAHLNPPRHSDIRAILREIRDPQGILRVLHEKGYRGMYFVAHTREVRAFLLKLGLKIQNIRRDAMTKGERETIERNRAFFTTNQTMLLWPGELLEESELYYVDLTQPYPDAAPQAPAQDAPAAQPLAPPETVAIDA